MVAGIVADLRPTAADYDDSATRLIERCLLHIATVLSDLMRDSVVVVGGLVPRLLMPHGTLPYGTAVHPGTTDLDLGLRLALLVEERYRNISRRLRDAGFEMDVNETGNPTRQRWRREALGSEMARVDFLIPPTSEDAVPGSIQHLESDFAAFIIPGVEMAFADQVSVALNGRTLDDEVAQRDVRVCGPAAFVALKALAFDGRGYPKDAYDLFYVLRNFGSGPRDVARRFGLIASDPKAREALSILERDFLDVDAPGAVRAARFLAGDPDDALRADVAAFVGDFLDAVGVVGE